MKKKIKVCKHKWELHWKDENAELDMALPEYKWFAFCVNCAKTKKVNI